MDQQNTISQKNIDPEFEEPIQETYSKTSDPFPFNHDIVQPKKKNKSEDNDIVKTINNVNFYANLKLARPSWLGHVTTVQAWSRDQAYHLSI